MEHLIASDKNNQFPVTSSRWPPLCLFTCLWRRSRESHWVVSPPTQWFDDTCLTLSGVFSLVGFVNSAPQRGESQPRLLRSFYRL